MISTVVPKSHIRALLEYGMVYDQRRRQWEGLDYILADADIEGLDLWELDQVIAGLRERARKVRVRNGYFYLKSED